MSLYLDASAIVPLFVQEPSSEQCVQMVRTDDTRPTVSDYGAGEVASVLARLVRQGEVTTQAARTVLSAFDQWAITAGQLVETRPIDMRHAGLLVRRFDLRLRFPDALHLTICDRLTLKLVTRDKLMGEAAQAIGIAVVTIP